MYLLNKGSYSIKGNGVLAKLGYFMYDFLNSNSIITVHFTYDICYKWKNLPHVSKLILNDRKNFQDMHSLVWRVYVSKL